MRVSGRRRLTALERADVAEHTVDRVFPHRAGVEQDKIRFLRIVGKRKAHAGQKPFHVLGIGYVLLTAKGAHAGQGRAPAKAAGVVLPHAGGISLLFFQFLWGNRSDVGRYGHGVPLFFCGQARDDGKIPFFSSLYSFYYTKRVLFFQSISREFFFRRGADPFFCGGKEKRCFFFSFLAI